MDEMAKNDGYFNIDIKYDALFKFINGNNDHFLEEIKSDQKIEEIDDLIRVTKEYLQTTQKTWGVMEWMEACYPEYFTIPPILLSRCELTTLLFISTKILGIDTKCIDI